MEEAAEQTKYTANKLVDMLRTKYPMGEYALLEQVPNGTGVRQSSWIDAAVFSLWPSNGIWRSAFEIKVSRNDFIRELNNPAKNEWARKHFNFFWYVCAPKVAKEEELPEGCGLMVANGSGLKTVRSAPRKSAELDDNLLAAFARAMDKSLIAQTNRARDEAVQSDSRYITAKYYYDGVRKFLDSLEECHYPKSADQVYETLVQINRNPDSKGDIVDAKHVLKVLDTFQDETLWYLQALVPLASRILTARDEAGKFITKAYKLHDSASIEEMTRMFKQAKNFHKEEHRRMLETKQTIQGES